LQLVLAEFAEGVRSDGSISAGPVIISFGVCALTSASTQAQPRCGSAIICTSSTTTTSQCWCRKRANSSTVQQKCVAPSRMISSSPVTSEQGTPIDSMRS